MKGFDRARHRPDRPGRLYDRPARFLLPDKWQNQIINVHPSLIPSFCGEGFYGLRVHEAALRKGVKVTGATVHFVSEVVDGGAIILQKAVEVQPGDTPEIAAKARHGRRPNTFCCRSAVSPVLSGHGCTLQDGRVTIDSKDQLKGAPELCLRTIASFPIPPTSCSLTEDLARQ